jgi:hypothetical protein
MNVKYNYLLLICFFIAEKLLMKNRLATRISNMNANIEPLTLIDIITEFLLFCINFPIVCFDIT